MSRSLAIAALGVCLCLLAKLFGVGAFLIPGVALVLAPVGAEIATRTAARRVRLEREPLQLTAEEGTRLQLTTRLVGPRALRRSGEFTAMAGSESRPRRWLEHDEQHFHARASHRGRHLMGPSMLRYGDPFGLCERTVRSPATELLVLPRVEPISGADLAKLATQTVTPMAAVASAGELDGLQPAQQYATAGRIHWPTSARTGTLMERRLRAALDSRPLVVLDGSGAAGSDAFDMAVRAAASLAVALARRGGCLLLTPPERRPHQLDASLASWPAIHRQLAVLEPSAAPAADAVRRAPRLLWVTARTDAPPVPARPPGSRWYLVSPFARPGGEVLFAVGGCAVQPFATRERAAAR